MSDQKIIPICPDPPSKHYNTLCALNYTIQLITPMFGGGCIAGMVDETMPIRGTEIRGNLQFWWRATCGANFQNLESMIKKHQKVWGSTDQKSSVIIDVNCDQPVQNKPSAHYGWNPQAKNGKGDWKLEWDTIFQDPLPYVLFPFKGKPPLESVPTPQQEPTHYLSGINFTLTITCPEKYRDDVETAVWAWVNFGGLGARTRRGCGSLFCRELAPKNEQEIHKWFREKMEHHPTESKGYPTLPRILLIGEVEKNAMEAWKKSITILQRFRQEKDFARNPGSKGRPGRSRFPEAKSIREIMKIRPLQHARMNDIPCNAFPRAELGLPIIFHFQGKGEPPDTTLTPSYEGKEYERMASPIILKPLALQNGKAIPLIIQLIAPQPKQVVLKQGKDPLQLPENILIRNSKLSSYGNSPLAKSLKGSALEAFMTYAKENYHFQEIPL